MPLKPHPTDPDKMVFVKSEYNLPKEWVGLTEDDLVNTLWPVTLIDVVRLVEAMLKEKNAF